MRQSGIAWRGGVCVEGMSTIVSKVKTKATSRLICIGGEGEWMELACRRGAAQYAQHRALNHKGRSPC